MSGHGRYTDQVVIVTGGSSGIGKGCAQEFVKAGAKVVICCNDEQEGPRPRPFRRPAPGLRPSI